jgi:ferrous iron transport protein A
MDLGKEEVRMSKASGNNNVTNSMSKRISLTQMRAGQRGKIVEIDGGYGLIQKLETLGVRECKEIKKISGQWMRGPVLLQCGNSQVALGFRMASRIFVEIAGKDK